MSTDTQPNILLFGAGSVGTVYLYLLSKTSTITAVCRSNYDVVKENGFILNSAIFGQDLRVTPNVVRSCEEAATSSPNPYDYILVCSKVTPGAIPKLIAPAITPRHTVIVLMQNGIGIEQEYVDAFPENPILSTVVYLPVSQPTQGVITHGEIELLEVGSYPSSAPNTHAEAFTNLVKAGGGTANLYEDIQLKRWTKLLVNAPWNPLCALTLSDDVSLLGSSSEAIDVVLAVMLEVVDIANAYGYALTRKDAEFQLGRATARIPINAGIVPSMLQDVREGRRIETEAIAGNTYRLGKAKGVKCDRIEMLYVLTKALDLQIGK